MNSDSLTRYSLIGLALVAVVVLESKIRIMGIKLNLLILFAYFAGLRHGPVSGLSYGAALGILADSLAGGMLGPRTLSLGTVGYLTSFLTGRLFTWTPLLGLFAVAVLTIVDGLIVYVSLKIFSSEAPAFGYAAIIVFWQAAINAIIGPCLRPGDEN